LNELTKRVIVAIIGIPLAIFVIYMGGILFTAAIIIISSLALWELYSITEMKSAHPFKILGIIFGVVLQLSTFLVYNYKHSFFFIFIIIVTLFLSVFITFIFQLFSNRENPVLNIASTIFGFFYVSLFLDSLILIREFTKIKFWNESGIIHNAIINNPIELNHAWGFFLLSIFFSVWLSDSAAYFIGKSIGKHKLYPRISPKKTWEGAIACFISAVISFPLLIKLFLNDFPIIHTIIIGVIIGIFGQIGDLAESQLKRDAGIKDSSTIIPGHGGFLDRFDSILFIGPIIYLYLVLLRM
jgi:phosphatidate cytidylyltransferase